METTIVRDKIRWYDQSRREYEYEIFKRGEELPTRAGNFCLAKEPMPNRWSPVYFGETENLSEVNGHDKNNCFDLYAATHIHVHFNDNRGSRRMEMENLVEMWSPPCNED